MLSKDKESLLIHFGADEVASMPSSGKMVHCSLSDQPHEEMKELSSSLAPPPHYFCGPSSLTSGKGSGQLPINVCFHFQDLVDPIG